jgi:hypothetical protein
MAITILITMLAMPTLLGLFALKQMTETQPRPVGVSPRRASVNPGLRITRHVGDLDAHLPRRASLRAWMADRSDSGRTDFHLP